MHFSKLSRSELLGMVAATVLVLALFLLDWYELANTPGRDDGDDFICGQGEYSCNGYDTFPILGKLLLAAAAAPFILAYIVMRGHRLSWAPGELTMVVGFTAFVLIAYNGIIDAPGTGTSEIGVTETTGYWVALVASAGIAAAGIGRSLEEQKGGAGARKPPGSV